MKRLAILIQAPLSGKYFLDGVRVDIAAWRRHLTSLAGGAWNSDEIVELKNPSKYKLQHAINQARNADFAIIAFSGHGFTVKNELGFIKTFVYINDNPKASESTVAADALNPGTKRCILSLDCCRKIEKMEPITEAFECFSDDGDSRTAYRTLYEQKVLACEEGCCRLYAASFQESAADNESFTQVLISIGGMAAESGETLTIKEGMDRTKEYFEKNNPQQHPSYNGGRRLSHFPFVIGV